MDFQDYLGFFTFIFGYSGYLKKKFTLEFFDIFWIFSAFYGFLTKLQRLLLRVTKVTTGKQKWAKAAC